MSIPRIHLIAPAGSCRSFLEQSGIASADRLIELVQEAVGSAFHVSGDVKLIDADENEARTGRLDDAQRAADITQALADDGVAAIAAIRGGAWLTRILQRIEFDVMDRRSQPVAMFGFSEITTLVNIIGAHEMGRGVYDNAPAFLSYGLRQYARKRASDAELGGLHPKPWAQSRLVDEFQAFFRDVSSMIEGKGSARELSGHLVRGHLPKTTSTELVGGNLTVVITLLASPYRDCVDVKNRWLVLEDYNDKPSRLDRQLAHLGLAGSLQECQGILLGDFHLDDEDLTEAVATMLDLHLRAYQEKPVLVCPGVGHVWPMAPVPVHLPVTINLVGDNEYAIRWSDSVLRTVS